MFFINCFYCSDEGEINLNDEGVSFKKLSLQDDDDGLEAYHHGNDGNISVT